MPSEHCRNGTPSEGGMTIAVAVKQVPVPSWIPGDECDHSVLDPHSQRALGMALSVRRQEDRVAVFTMGPPGAKEVLRRCLELGADQAFLLTDPAFEGSDVRATSRTLAAFLDRHLDAGIIFTGGRSADGGTAQVPAELAQMLGIEQFYYTESVQREDGSFVIRQNYGDEIRTSRASGRVLVSVADGPADPWPPAKAGDGGITEMDRVSLNLGIYSVGTRGSRTRVVRTSPAGEDGTAGRMPGPAEGGP